MHFHTEVIELPISLLVGEEGWFAIQVYGYSEDTELAIAGDGINIYYKKVGQKIYFSKIYK